MLIAVVFPCGGATCARQRRPMPFTPPIVFSEKPTLEQLLTRLNRTGQIERMNSYSVSLSSPASSISLDGNLSWHRPDEFRLQASPVARACSAMRSTLAATPTSSGC